ncbi:MAG: hypothetical protein RJA22_1609, partial [Verrucomicrobiota bacterium]
MFVTNMNFNTLLAIYTGNAVNALTLVTNRGDANFTPPVNVVVFQAVQGTTYRIAVDARRFG